MTHLFSRVHLCCTTEVTYGLFTCPNNRWPLHSSGNKTQSFSPTILFLLNFIFFHIRCIGFLVWRYQLTLLYLENMLCTWQFLHEDSFIACILPMTQQQVCRCSMTAFWILASTGIPIRAAKLVIAKIFLSLGNTSESRSPLTKSHRQVLMCTKKPKLLSSLVNFNSSDTWTTAMFFLWFLGGR